MFLLLTIGLALLVGWAVVQEATEGRWLVGQRDGREGLRIRGDGFLNCVRHTDVESPVVGGFPGGLKNYRWRRLWLWDACIYKWVGSESFGWCLVPFI